MKKQMIMAVFLSALAAAIFTGCSTPYRTTYIVTGAFVQSVELAREAFVAYENSCLCVTQAQHDQVAGAYGTYQKAVATAAGIQKAYNDSADKPAAGLQASVDAENAAALAAAGVVDAVGGLLPATNKAALQKKIAATR